MSAIHDDVYMIWGHRVHLQQQLLNGNRPPPNTCGLFEFYFKQFLLILSLLPRTHKQETCVYAYDATDTYFMKCQIIVLFEIFIWLSLCISDFFFLCSRTSFGVNLLCLMRWQAESIQNEHNFSILYFVFGWWGILFFLSFCCTSAMSAISANVI